MKKLVGNLFRFCGVENVEHKRLLLFLIRDESDLNTFMSDYYNGDIVNSMVKFQQYKRDNNQLSKGSFTKLFQKNQKVAIEMLFQEPISESQLEHLLNYNVNHEQLWDRLEKNPNESYLGIVKGNSSYNKPFNDDFLLSL